METKHQTKELEIQQINSYLDKVREHLIKLLNENDVELFIEDINQENYDSMDKSKRSIKGSVLEMKIGNDSVYYSINKMHKLL